MLTLHVPAMSCGHCAGRIEKAVHGVDSAATVNADIAAATVAITSSASADAIRAAVEAAGYPNTIAAS